MKLLTCPKCGWHTFNILVREREETVWCGGTYDDEPLRPCGKKTIREYIARCNMCGHEFTISRVEVP